MTKKVLMFSSLIVLISSFLLINRLQAKNFTVFNDVNPQQIEEVKESLIHVEELEFTALLCNEIRVPFDNLTNTFLVPLDMEDSHWEKIEFVSVPKDDIAVQRETAQLVKQLAEDQNLQDAKHEILSIVHREDHICVTCQIVSTENIAGRKNLSLQ